MKKTFKNGIIPAIRFLGKYNRSILWGLLFSLVGFMMMFLFNEFNENYILRVNAGHIVGRSDVLFGRYLDIVLFFVLYFVCGLVFCIKVSGENADFSLVLIMVYLVIGILNQINEFNYGDTLIHSLYDLFSNSLYELSVVPIIFYVALKLKRLQKHMMFLMFSELLACILYIIGVFAKKDSALYVFKHISCSAIFLVVFLMLFIFAIMEARMGNIHMKRFVYLEIIFFIFSAFSILISIVFRNQHLTLLGDAWYAFLKEYDISPFRRLFLQNILIFTVAADVVIGYVHDFIYKREMRNSLEFEMALAKEYADNVKARMDEVRTIKHDIKNHIGLLNMYYLEGNYEKLGEYLSQLEGSIVELRPLTYSKNRLIDYILMSYSEKFKGEGFEFHASARVSDNLPIPDSELCSLITNMLSNALEACHNSEGENNGGHVRFIMSMTKTKVQIRCENSCSKRKYLKPTGDVLETEKTKNRAAHGYGMGIIRNICEKNGGAVLFSAEDGIFVVSAVLPLNY